MASVKQIKTEILAKSCTGEIYEVTRLLNTMPSADLPGIECGFYDEVLQNLVNCHYKVGPQAAVSSMNVFLFIAGSYTSRMAIENGIAAMQRAGNDEGAGLLMSYYEADRYAAN